MEGGLRRLKSSRHLNKQPVRSYLMEVLGYLISAPRFSNEPTGFEIVAMRRLAEVGTGDKSARSFCAGISDNNLGVLIAALSSP